MRPIFLDTLLLLHDNPTDDTPTIYLNVSPSKVPLSILIEVQPTHYSLPTRDGKDDSTDKPPLDNRYFKEFVIDGHELLVNALIFGKCDVATFVSKYNLDECKVGIVIPVDGDDGSTSLVMIFDEVLPFDSFKLREHMFLSLDINKTHTAYELFRNKFLVNDTPFFTNMHKVKSDKMLYESNLKERNAIRNQGFIRLPGSM